MNRFLISVGAGAIMLCMGACASQRDSATGPTTTDLQLTSTDSALIAVHASADATVSDVNMLNGISATMAWSLDHVSSGAALDVSAGGQPSFASGPGSNCTYNPATGRFDCPAQVNGNGVSVVRSLAFYDTAGTLMNHFDSTTASMNVQATLSGVIPTALGGADTVNGTRNLTATGLFGHNTTRTWNGAGNSTHDSFWSDSAASRTASVSFSSTFSDVVVDLPRSANPYPVSGTITRIVTGTGVVTKNGRTKTITISRTVVVTFNGTQTAQLSVQGQTYALDLVTGTAVRH